MSRTPKLTPAVQARIVELVAAGNYFAVACRAAGISQETGNEWMARGEGRHHDRGDPDGRHARFARSVREAEAEAERYAVEALRNGFDKDFRAAVEYLKRKHPDRWREQTTVEQTGVQRHELDLSGLSVEEKRQLRDLLARASQSALPPAGEAA
jgi:hypothetical protein